MASDTLTPEPDGPPRQSDLPDVHLAIIARAWLDGPDRFGRAADLRRELNAWLTARGL
jgi:hypothetical protein